jgi:hypothetical protein
MKHEVRTHRELVADVREAVDRAVPAGANVAVISKGDDDLVRLDRHVGRHFPSLDDSGSHEYPRDSADAIAQLEDLMREGVRYLVVPATGSWWLEHYGGLRAYLDDHHRPLHDEEDVCVIYALDGGVPERGPHELAPAAEPRAELVESPIVVYGVPRSGTTYLRQLLSAHPETFITNETRIFTWARAALENLRRSVHANRDQFEAHFREALPRLIRDFYAELAPAGARYWGEKNPYYGGDGDGGWLETIEALFPGARFIQVVRDGRDVVSSLVRKAHEDGRPWADFGAAHQVWLRNLALAREFGGTLPPDSYLEVRYEELVADDLDAARRVFGFLGLDLHPRVEQFCRRQRHERTPFSGPTRNLARGADVSDWEAVFTPHQRLESLELLGGELVALGYETDDSLSERLADLRRVAGTSADGRT